MYSIMWLKTIYCSSAWTVHDLIEQIRSEIVHEFDSWSWTNHDFLTKISNFLVKRICFCYFIQIVTIFHVQSEIVWMNFNLMLRIFSVHIIAC